MSGTDERQLGKVYHDMRTSLGGILSTSWLLQKGMAGPVSADQLRFLENITTAAKEMAALVDGLDPAGTGRETT